MDYSYYSKLLSCPRSYQYSVIERLAPANERDSIKFGSAWHAILYEHALDPVELSGAETFVDWVLEKLKWEDPLVDYRTGAKLRRGFRRYLEHHQGSPFKYVQQEASFRMHIGLEEPWEGRKDAVVTWNSEEGKGTELWVVDYKTTSRLNIDWVDFYRNSNQFKGYYMSAKKEWPELAGVVVDVYHATKGAKNGKSFEEIEGNRFYRLPIRYDEYTLAEAERDFAVGITTSKMYKELGYYPKNTSACQQFGTTCPFLELCGASSDEDRNRLRATFVENTFDPHAPVGV